MCRYVRRFVSIGLGALLFVLLLIPIGVQASSSEVGSVTSAHLARALAKAPPGVKHWTIVFSKMKLSVPSKTFGREGAEILTNTVYGDCGSAWMAIGNQGAGNAWISLGWDVYYSAYWESWSTGVVPQGSNGGSGPIPPWNSTSWDTGYSSWEGYWVWTTGAAYMTAYMYPGQAASACASNGPTASALITP